MLQQHTGEVLGDFYGDLPLVTEDLQLRAIGYLEILGLMPRRLTMIGNLVEVPNAPVAPPPPPPAAAGGAAAPASPSAVHSPVADLATLEKVYVEHMKLKQMGIVRMFRKLGLFDMARKVMPGSRKYIGDGKKPQP
jgi:hypothetical protein